MSRPKVFLVNASVLKNLNVNQIDVYAFRLLNLYKPIRYIAEAELCFLEIIDVFFLRY